MFCNYYENSKLLYYLYYYICNNIDWYVVEDLSCLLFILFEFFLKLFFGN